MQSEVAVILPDGSYDFSAGHLVNEDVPVVPLHPEVDLLDVFLPEFDGFRDYFLRTLTHDRIDEILGFGKGEGIVVDRDRVALGFGNKPGGTIGYEAIRDAINDGQVIVFDGLPWYPVVSRNGAIQARYREMRRNNQSHKMAEMLATRTFPGVKTDAVFNEGKFSGDSGSVGAEQTWLRAQAEAAGVSTNGKWYCRGLASFPGDPTAWVGDRGDVLRIAREKNMTVHGYVEHKGHEEDPGDDLPIASDIIEDEVADVLESNPFADPDAVREEVYRLRTGAVDPNPLVLQDSHEGSLNISE